MRGDPPPPITPLHVLLLGAKPYGHVSPRVPHGKRGLSNEKRPRCDMTVVLRNQVERFDEARRPDSAHVVGMRTTVGPHHERLVAETGQSYPTRRRPGIPWNVDGTRCLLPLDFTRQEVLLLRELTDVESVVGIECSEHTSTGSHRDIQCLDRGCTAHSNRRLPLDLEHSAPPLPVFRSLEETAWNRRRSAGNAMPYRLRNLVRRNEVRYKLDRCEDDPTIRQSQRQQLAIAGQSDRLDRNLLRRTVERKLPSVHRREQPDGPRRLDRPDQFSVLVQRNGAWRT